MKIFNSQRNVFIWHLNRFCFHIYTFDPLEFIPVYSVRCGSSVIFIQRAAQLFQLLSSNSVLQKYL